MKKKKTVTPISGQPNDESLIARMIQREMIDFLKQNTPAPNVSDPVDYSFYFLKTCISIQVVPDDIPDTLLDAWIAGDNGGYVKGALPTATFRITPESLPVAVFLKTQDEYDDFHAELSGTAGTPSGVMIENYTIQQSIFRTIRQSRKDNFQVLPIRLFDYDEYPKLTSILTSGKPIKESNPFYSFLKHFRYNLIEQKRKLLEQQRMIPENTNKPS